MAPRRERYPAGVTDNLALVETMKCTKWVWGYEDELQGWTLAVSVAYDTVKPTFMALCFTLSWHSRFMVAPCLGSRNARLNLM